MKTRSSCTLGVRVLLVTIQKAPRQVLLLTAVFDGRHLRLTPKSKALADRHPHIFDK
jgi:hypothetical protein